MALFENTLKQIKLAADLGINEYPCPAGGCLLTDPLFSKKGRDLMKYDILDMKKALRRIDFSKDKFIHADHTRHSGHEGVVHPLGDIQVAIGGPAGLVHISQISGYQDHSLVGSFF